MPTVYRCPGIFGGASIGVSSSGWTVLFILGGLVGVLGYLTVKSRGERITLQDFIDLIPKEIPQFSLSWPPWQSGPKYGRVPESALDDDLDLGDEEEAEELHDGDMYDNPNRPLGTLPVRSHSDAQAPRLPLPASSPPPPPAVEGSLLGEEFTSPHADIGKKGD
uniref:Uncharacterized protein n=1 Tax=Haptolina ericina TaxID=156174 RepID=A0A7S3C5G3_9EUKA